MPRPVLRRYFRHGLFPQLMVFEAVARLSSVTRAAEELHLAQPTISVQLKKLSGALGLTLLEQQGKRWRLTPAGDAVGAACRELTDLFSRLEQVLATMRPGQTEVLRIASLPGGRHHASRILAAFCVRHPGIQASLHVARREEVLARLVGGEDELCLLAGSDGADWLDFLPVTTELLHIYAAARHALARARAIAPERLAAEPLVLRESGSRTREALFNACGWKPTQVTVRAELAGNEAIAEVIAGGVGVGLLPENDARAFVEAGAIAALDVRGFPLRRQWNIAYARSRKRSALAELFLREVEEKDATPQPLGVA
jgi:DNA-binding transcriptional LysR family regulator